MTTIIDYRLVVAALIFTLNNINLTPKSTTNWIFFSEHLFHTIKWHFQKKNYRCSRLFFLFLLFILQSSSLISNATATALLSLGAIDYCLHVLKSLLEFWKTQQGEEEPAAASQLLKPHTSSSPPDMSPFFLRQYVKVIQI